MKTPSKNTVIKLLNTMYCIIIPITIIGVFFDFQRAISGLGILVLMLIGSELPLRRYYKGKPMMVFGRLSDAETEEETENSLIWHLSSITLGFILIVSNIIYAIWTNLA